MIDPEVRRMRKRSLGPDRYLKEGRARTTPIASITRQQLRAEARRNAKAIERSERKAGRKADWRDVLKRED